MVAEEVSALATPAVLGDAAAAAAPAAAEGAAAAAAPTVGSATASAPQGRVLEQGQVQETIDIPDEFVGTCAATRTRTQQRGAAQ